jgi:hypothetical protein
MEYYFKIFEEAFNKGKKAHEACIPTPQGFYSADLSDKPLSEVTIDPEGNCGGAYITGIGGRDEIVRFFKKHGRFDGSHNYALKDDTRLSKGVYKGYDLMVSTNKFYNGQSAERKAAFCEAYAKVLNDNGIKCHVRTYLT